MTHDTLKNKSVECGIRPMASPRGNGWVRTPHFCSDSSRDYRKTVEKLLILYIGRGGVPCIYIVTLLLTSKEKLLGPHFFWADYATGHGMVECWFADSLMWI